jgi:predicted house-cleaning noncanonical NTP pyrophosphatase (MazG superfamily)
MNKLAEEVNELLHDKESLELSELTSLYELPGEFVQQVIKL